MVSHKPVTIHLKPLDLTTAQPISRSFMRMFALWDIIAYAKFCVEWLTRYGLSNLHCLHNYRTNKAHAHTIVATGFTTVKTCCDALLSM